MKLYGGGGGGGRVVYFGNVDFFSSEVYYVNFF